MSIPPAHTFTYSSHSVQLDAYVPHISGSLAAFIVFHGGGMTAGSKSDLFFPTWLIEKAMSKGIIVISANYRLLHPSTPEDIITDTHDLFKYLADPTSELALFLAKTSNILDANRLGVVGISGGNYPARVAASMTTVLPRPKVWIPLYGMAGDFLLDHWVQPSPDDGGLAGLARDPSAVAALLDHAETSSDAPLKFVPALKKASDDENRVGLFVHFYRTGTLVDYIAGIPGISEHIRLLPYEERLAAIPDTKIKYLLPLGKDTIPAFVIHGTLDTVVPQAEGVKTWNDLQDLGVTVEHAWVEGALHGLLDPKNMPNRVPGWEEAADRGLEFAARLMQAS